MNFNRLVQLCVLFSFSLHTQSFGAVLKVESGTLLGASGIEVNGALYDVAFLDGTCEALFDGCDDNSDFIFNGDLELGKDAHAALMEQVFVDSSLGAFDSFPSLTNGCQAAACQTNTPVSFSGGGSSLALLWVSNNEAEVRDIATGSGTALLATDTTLQAGGNYAVWRQSVSAVPLPAALWFFGSGLFGLACVARR